MASLAKRPHKELEKKLGYKFRDAAHLILALSHASSRGSGASINDNERLEFLGDRVLGLAIAEMLAETFPHMAEGELSLRFTRLVRGETCAEVARALDLGAHLKVSSSEKKPGGKMRETILADACEALLGAVFLDGGYDKARKVIRLLWGDRLRGVAEIRTDAKTALQEWAQGRGLPLPRYVIKSRSGPDHAPRFEVAVEIKGLENDIGIGASKRIAEQSAAQALLEREGVWVKGASADG